MLGQSVIPKQLEWNKSETAFLQLKFQFILGQKYKQFCHFEIAIKVQLVPSRGKWQLTSSVGFFPQKLQVSRLVVSP